MRTPVVSLRSTQEDGQRLYCLSNMTECKHPPSSSTYLSSRWARDGTSGLSRRQKWSKSSKLFLTPGPPTNKIGESTSSQLNQHGEREGLVGARTVYSIAKRLVDGYNMLCRDHADVVHVGKGPLGNKTGSTYLSDALHTTH